MLVNQLTKCDGIIPRFFRQTHCWLFEGHEWQRCSPEYQGYACYKCTKCGKTSVF